MKTRLRNVLLTLAVTAVSGTLFAQPPEGSKLPPEDNACAMCHGEADLWEEDKLQFYVPAEKLADDVHWKNGVNCHDCHGGDPSVYDPSELHAAEDGFRKLEDVKKVCGNCHQEQLDDLQRGDAHRAAGEKNEQGRGTPLPCQTCHGDKGHGILPVGDPQSPAFLDNQVKTCGRCHQEPMSTYRVSVHGHGLYESGLLVTAACADCHGAHAMYYTSDQRSPLYPANVADTCGKCHRYIQDTLQQSVHGRGAGPGHLADRAAPGGNGKRTPSCTDCHQGHDLPHPKEAAFRLSLRHRCGNCHPRHSDYYSMSVHGELTELGYGPAANCSDCHGAHTILPVSDPNSPLSPAHRLDTCRKCHPATYAGSNFLQFDPHADHHDPERDPVLYWVYRGLMTLLICVFGFFGLHSLLWFVRSLVEVVKHGRPKGLVPGGTGFQRFRPFHRVAHTVMLVSFLGLALTGLPLKYSHYDWAKSLAHFLGGFESTGVWHRIFGVLLFGCFLAYAYRLLRRYVVDRRQGVSRRGAVFGPDSPIPTWRDVKDFAKMNRWFLGMGPKPTFERWSYWEKFDFWGAVADTVIIGLTGLILWFPNQFCIFLPGSAINIAKVIHSTQALLATGFVFAIHFFNTHIRAEKFPADLCVLTGLVSEEEFREERPEYYERMRREGRLDEVRGTVPTSTRLWLYRLGGFVALAIGMSLLAGMIVAGLAK